LHCLHSHHSTASAQLKAWQPQQALCTRLQSRLLSEVAHTMMLLVLLLLCISTGACRVNKTQHRPRAARLLSPHLCTAAIPPSAQCRTDGPACLHTRSCSDRHQWHWCAINTQVNLQPRDSRGARFAQALHTVVTGTQSMHAIHTALLLQLPSVTHAHDALHSELATAQLGG
jgi:hypothetical protein